MSSPRVGTGASGSPSPVNGTLGSLKAVRVPDRTRGAEVEPRPDRHHPPDLRGHVLDGLVLHLEPVAQQAGELAEDLPGLHPARGGHRALQSLHAPLGVGHGAARLRRARQRQDHGGAGGGGGEEQVAHEQEVGGQQAVAQVLREPGGAHRVLAEHDGDLDLLVAQELGHVQAGRGEVAQDHAQLLLHLLQGLAAFGVDVAGQPARVGAHVEQPLHVRLLAQGEQRAAQGRGRLGEEPLVVGQPRATVVLVEQHHLEDGLRQDGGRLARGGARHSGELLEALVGEIGHRPGQLRPVVEGARPQGGVVLQQAEDGEGLPAGQAAQVELGKARGAVVLRADVDEAGALADRLLAGDVHHEVLLVEGRVDHQEGLGVAEVRVGGRGDHVRGLQLAVDEVGERRHVVRAQGHPGQLLGEVDLLVGQARRDEHRDLVAAVAAGELLEPHAGVAQGLVEASSPAARARRAAGGQRRRSADCTWP